LSLGHIEQHLLRVSPRGGGNGRKQEIRKTDPSRTSLLTFTLGYVISPRTRVFSRKNELSAAFILRLPSGRTLMLPHEQLIDDDIDNSRALRETQAQYQPVSDMAPLAIYSCDAEGHD